MASDFEQTNTRSQRLRRWQRVTVSSLCIGYAGYYLCRSNLSVATPLLLEELGPRGVDKEMMGLIASVGVLAYAIGKMISGLVCDFLGGRRMFLLGMVGSILATVLFGLWTGAAVMMFIWSVNRLVQSTGWVALVKITSNWFPFAQYGTVMGILSLSFLFGDAFARLFLGGLISAGVGWRGVFYAAAIGLTVIAVGCQFLLKNSPVDIGADEPEVNPRNVYGQDGARHSPDSIRGLLRPILSSYPFWLAAAMSLGLTLIRETFNFWTPTYLVEVGQMSTGAAASFSLLFPLFGGVSVLVFGRLADRSGGDYRGKAILAGLIPLVVILGLMAVVQQRGAVSLILVSLAALAMIGPYSFLAGAISLDLGGKQGSSTAASLIDAAGYLGATISGMGIGALVQRVGWDAAYGFLACVALTAVVAAVAYWRLQESKRRD